MAAFLVIQDGGEDAGRIEVRQTQPIDRAVHGHERRRPQVADYSMILDGLIVGHDKGHPDDK